MPFTIANPAGRLIIVTIVAPTTAEESVRLGRELLNTLGRQPHGGVFATDLTGLQMLSPEIADSYIRIMRSDNKLLVRGALLVAGPGSSMQLHRLVKESGADDKRRVFTDAPTMVQWLHQILEPEEGAALARHFRLDARTFHA